MAISTLVKQEPVPTPSPIFLTGATGYIGGRLLRVLQNAGHRVRCVTRRPETFQSCVATTTEVVSGNVLDQESLTGTMDGVEIAYYMVHSMGSKGDFEEQDRRAAHNFGQEARRAGVGRIIYLGGLGETSGELSPHLRSRQIFPHIRPQGVRKVRLATKTANAPQRTGPMRVNGSHATRKVVLAD